MGGKNHEQEFQVCCNRSQTGNHTPRPAGMLVHKQSKNFPIVISDIREQKTEKAMNCTSHLRHSWD